MRKSFVLYFFMILVPGYSLCQNIGIGTTIPNAKLHIKGSADTSQLVIERLEASFTIKK